MTDGLNMPWAQIDKPQKGKLSKLRVSPNHPGDFWWGLDSSGARLLIIGGAAKACLSDKIPSPQGIEILKTGQQLSDGSTQESLVLKLLNHDDQDIFQALCEDLITTTRKITDAEQRSSIILSRLDRWMQFLRKAADKLLTTAEQIGLIGELIFLRDFILNEFSPEQALDTWAGPAGNPQDFAFGHTAVEIKTNMLVSHPRITISSLAQLDSDVPRLYLVVPRLNISAGNPRGKFSLNGLIQDLTSHFKESRPALATRFESLLYELGYTVDESYDSPEYVLVETLCFNVRDDFPRLRQEHVKDGISGIRYQIDLEACMPFQIQKQQLFESADTEQ